MTRRLTRRRLLQLSAAGALGATLAHAERGAAREADEVQLVSGWNARTWCGPDTSIVDATAALPLRIAHSWSVPEQRWTSYAPGAPINTIGTLKHGQPLWIRVDRDAIWRQPWYRGALPEPQALPIGWSFLGWSGLHEPVWTAFGEQPLGLVVEARRWNTELKRWLVYRPGQPAQQLFAVLHPGDAVWVKMRTSGARWNPAAGVVDPQRPDGDTQLVRGEITYYHPSLAGGPMYCTGRAYDPQDATVGAAVTWPCGARLRIWRDERYVDVIIQDTGLLGPNHVDLSEAAFERLALLSEGRVSVLIEVLAGPS